MKYANYMLTDNTTSYIGDWMQIVAIDELYRQMGVDLSEIVYISTNELNSYRGEYFILPVSMPLINYIEGGLAKMFSDYIIPVFLGLTMVKDTLEKEEATYLRQYAPIGCRDKRTLLTLRKYGIQSFLNGCFTITMPNRCHSKENDLKEADWEPMEK